MAEAWAPVTTWVAVGTMAEVVVPATGVNPAVATTAAPGRATVAATAGAAGSSSHCFPAGSGTDFTSDGPLMATSADNTTVACTIFQPTVLGSGGCLNPVIVWGNGTFNTPSSYTALFNHWATHGFIVAAADTSNSGSGKEMLACLKYIIAQNTTAGSPFMGHVDVNHIASSGYSQGGAGCLEARDRPPLHGDGGRLALHRDLARWLRPEHLGHEADPPSVHDLRIGRHRRSPVEQSATDLHGGSRAHLLGDACWVHPLRSAW